MWERRNTRMSQWENVVIGERPSVRALRNWASKAECDGDSNTISSFNISTIKFDLVPTSQHSSHLPALAVQIQPHASRFSAQATRCMAHTFPGYLLRAQKTSAIPFIIADDLQTSPAITCYSPCTDPVMLQSHLETHLCSRRPKSGPPAC